VPDIFTDIETEQILNVTHKQRERNQSGKFATKKYLKSPPHK